MAYLYETHMHTCLASACGVSTGKEHVRFYKERGYTGIIITDHFFGGNTCVPRNLPWGEEYLLYGLKKDWMKAHPELERWTRREQLEAVHGVGGCVIQAHPFRMRGYMDKIRLAPDFCDGWEGANAGNQPEQDARARRYAQAHGILMTAGSDNHHSPRETLFGVELEERLTSLEDYVRLILNRGKIKLHVPDDWFRLPEGIQDGENRAWLLDEKENTVVLPEWQKW